MCWEGKCIGCIEVETGTMILAVINSVFWAVVIIGSTIGIILANVAAPRPENFIDKYENYDVYRRVDTTMMCLTIGLSVLLVLSVIHFIFSVFLCNGVSKREVNHIKAFFIYGVVKMVLESLAVVIAISIVPMFALLIIPLVIYGLFLHMVNMTYKKFNASEIYSHKPLVEMDSRRSQFLAV